MDDAGIYCYNDAVIMYRKKIEQISTRSLSIFIRITILKELPLLKLSIALGYEV